MSTFVYFNVSSSATVAGGRSALSMPTKTTQNSSSLEIQWIRYSNLKNNNGNVVNISKHWCI